MQFVSEEQIDRAAAELEQSEADYEAAIEAIKAAQPVLLAYPFSESFEAFTREEQTYFLYLTLVIWKATKSVNDDLPFVDEARLSELEEANWNIIQGNKGNTFRSRLDPFFENYAQEDLLAFVEDALTQDEDGEEIVSREGQEALFVCLKSVVDALTQVPS
jgi:hypothetical protein